MITDRRRQVGLLTTGLLGAVLLSGCSSQDEGASSSASSSSSSSSSSGSAPATSPSAGASTAALDDVADLSAGLLPAEAFGPDARATPVTAEQLAQGQSSVGGLGLKDVTVTPEQCAPAVQSVQPALDGVTGLGAQTVTVGPGATVEVLAAGAGVADGVERLAATVDACPEATIAAPQFGTIDVTFSALQVPDVGDASAGFTMVAAIPGPDGRPVTVPVLLAMARDGDRLLSLTTTDPTGATDAAAFGALLQQAYEHQADALD
jgi:hypothetical protein